ncbi:MAG: DNA integrity scanning diadenylate cyclase DisA [Candidatus Pacearchaeota archaeon]|nr:DNA integrity scanning diadenylate cyclase DisA [Candidatus Pacearchaeota archaeon]
MGEEKEVQAILGKEEAIVVPSAKKATKEELYNVLKLVAPGTSLRSALDSIMKTGKGALIVIENDSVIPLLDGGFRVNCRFTPQRLVELSKMDGAIIISRDLKRLLDANVLLTPDSKIPTNETGTRHKAAERTAKQTGCVTIAVSERRHEITLFYKNVRYVIKDTGELLRKANEQMQLLEKHRELFDFFLEKLNRAELKNSVNFGHAIHVIQKGRIIEKIARDLRKYIIELGNEGILLRTRLKEITMNVEKETDLVIKDYSKIGLAKSKKLLGNLSYDELLDIENIKKVLACEGSGKGEVVKGWRLLSKTSLQEQEIAALIKEFGGLGKILYSDIGLYKNLLGEDKSLLLKEEIEKIKGN